MYNKYHPNDTEPLIGDNNSLINYKTSSQAQSDLIPLHITNRDNSDKELIDNLKKDNFKIANNELYGNDYSTNYHREYYDKSKKNNCGYSKAEIENFKNKLKKSEYILGNDKLTYMSENKKNYKWNTIDYNNQRNEYNHNKLIQQSRVQIGYQNTPWSSTNKSIFTPKPIDNNRYNFKYFYQNNINNIPEKDDRNFISESRYSYDKKPLPNKIINNEFKIKPKSTLILGNDNLLMKGINSITKSDYVAPKVNNNYNEKVNIEKYRKDNWSFGPNNEGNFSTVYQRAMTPKKLEEPVPQFPHKCSIQIGYDNNKDYNSNYKLNYGNKIYSERDLKDLDFQKKVFEYHKNSHLNIGKGQGIYDTTSGDNYKFNSELAKKNWEVSNNERKNRNYDSNYQFGNDNIKKETTNKHDYKFYNTIEKNEKIRHNSELDLGNKSKFNGISIYKSDYIKKPLPDEYEEDEVFDRVINIK